MDYTTIYETINTAEISIIRNLLDDYKINYRLPDEFTNSFAGIAGLGIRGMRIQVLDQDKEKAIILLKERGFKF